MCAHVLLGIRSVGMAPVERAADGVRPDRLGLEHKERAVRELAVGGHTHHIFVLLALADDLDVPTCIGRAQQHPALLALRRRPLEPLAQQLLLLGLQGLVPVHVALRRVRGARLVAAPCRRSLVAIPHVTLLPQAHVPVAHAHVACALAELTRVHERAQQLGRDRLDVEARGEPVVREG